MNNNPHPDSLPGRIAELRDRAETAEAEIATLRTTIETAAETLRLRPIKTPLDDGVIRLLEGALVSGDAGQALLTELRAARAYLEAQDPEAPLLPAEEMIGLWQAWKKARGE